MLERTGKTATGRRTLAATLLAFLALAAACRKPAGSEPQGHHQAGTRKKVLFINSYHPGYDWSDGITRAVASTLGASVGPDGRVDDGKAVTRLKVIYLDTKRHRSEDFKRKAGERARRLIEEWKPDLVITADDNAARYVIVPYYLGGDLPFVFCGINQDAGRYGLPARNVTGMVEIFLLSQAIGTIRPYAGGDRICAIGADTVSERKNIGLAPEKYGVVFHRVYYADTFAELEEAYLTSQAECDMDVLFEFFSVRGFDRQRFLDTVMTQTRIPSAAMYAFNRDFVLVSCANDPAEQGEWAARAALTILAGKSPSQIPVATNHRARIYLNMQLARKLGIVFPMSLIEQATFTGESH